MNFNQKQMLQRLAAAQDLQSQDSDPAVDFDSLYREAEELITDIVVHPDPGTLEELESYWGEAMATLGAEWERLLDEVLATAEEAALSEASYHHNGDMYWRVLDRCYQRIQDQGEDSAFCQRLFLECLSCLRATATLHESLAR